MRLLLGAHRSGLAASDIEQPGLLGDLPAFFDQLDLAARLVLDRLHYIAHRVQILDLAARAIRLARAAHRHIGVAAQRAFLHIAVTGAEIAQDRAQFAQIEPCFLGAAQVGFGHNLHQPDPRPVQIDIGQARMLVVQALAGVLFEMQPGDANLSRRAVRHVEHDPPTPNDGSQILRDLIAGGEVGVEIVLAVKDAGQIDLGIKPEPSLNRLLDAMAVNDRQHAGKRRVDRRNLGIRLGAEIRGRPGKQFRLRDDLGVHLKPDHHLPLAGPALDQHRHLFPAARTIA